MDRPGPACFDARVRGSVGAGLVALALLASCGGEPAREVSRSPLPNPYPFVTPTPPAEPSAIDGTYVREVPEEAAGPLGKCKRCPPYRLELGDTNTLTIRDGVLRVANELVGWESRVHVFVEEDSIRMINDPNCLRATGEYGWRLDGDALIFELIADDCAFGGLRSRYLTVAPWVRSG